MLKERKAAPTAIQEEKVIKCVNASIAAPQTSSQPCDLSPSAEHASQPSVPTPPQPLEHDSYALPPCVKANRPCTQLPPTPSPLSSSVQPQSTQVNEQQLFSPDYLPSPESCTALRTEEAPSSAMPSCCKCKGDNARCVSCKCCKENRACVNCLPGRRGKCVNIRNVLSQWRREGGGGGHMPPGAGRGGGAVRMYI